MPRPDPPVHIHIDTLELHGIPEARKHAVAAAFERELGRRLALEPLAAAPEGVPELSLPALRVRGDAAPHRIGAELARLVHAGLRGPSGSGSGGPQGN